MKELYQRINYFIVNFAGSEANFADMMGIHLITLNKYLQKENQNLLLPLIPKIIEIYPIINKKWLFFGEGNILNKTEPLSATDIANMLPTPNIDKATLFNVIKTLEEALTSAKTNLPPKNKGDIVAQLYKILSDGEASQIQKDVKIFKTILEAINKDK